MSANKTRFSDKVRKMDFDKLEEVRQKQYKVAVAKVIKGFEEDPVNAEKQLDKLILGLDRLTADAVKVAESTPHEAVRKASKIEKGIIADVKKKVIKIKAKAKDNVAKGKSKWQSEVKDIQKKFKLDWNKAFSIWKKENDKKKEKVKAKKVTVAKMVTNLRANPIFKGKKGAISRTPYPPNATRDLKKDAKQPAINTVRRKSPTYGKVGGAKKKYYYEYRWNRMDVRPKAKVKLAEGGEIKDARYVPVDEIIRINLKDGRVIENDWSGRSGKRLMSGLHVSNKEVTSSADKSQMSLFKDGGKMPKNTVYLKRRDIKSVEIGEDVENVDETIKGSHLYNGVYFDDEYFQSVVTEAKKEGRFAKGGSVKERKYTSQQPHEQAYKSKRKSPVVGYKKMAKGGQTYAEGGVLTKAELKLNIYEPSGDYYMEKKGGKIILHLTSKDASSLPPSFFERYNVEDNGKGYYGTSYIVSKKRGSTYAEGGDFPLKWMNRPKGVYLSQNPSNSTTPSFHFQDEKEVMEYIREHNEAFETYYKSIDDFNKGEEYRKITKSYAEGGEVWTSRFSPSQKEEIAEVYKDYYEANDGDISQEDIFEYMSANSTPFPITEYELEVLYTHGDMNKYAEGGKISSKANGGWGIDLKW